MILYLMTVTELLVGRGAYGNELLDKFSNPLMVDGGEVGFSTNLWIMDSRIYSAFAGKGRFVIYLSYYDMGSFTYQSTVPDDSSWLTFSPYSMFGALAWKFTPDRNVHMSIRAGYYENRVMNDGVSALLVDFDLMATFGGFEGVAYFHNLNPLRFFRGGQLLVPYMLGGGIRYTRGSWSAVAGVRKVMDRQLEKFATLNYRMGRYFMAGITLEPDYQYSKFSLHVKAQRGPLALAYRVMIPSVQSDLVHIVTLEYSYAAPGF